MLANTATTAAAIHPGPLVHGPHEPAPRMGRPPKDLSERQASDVLDELWKDGTFAEACARAGTSAYIVRREMRALPPFDFEVRFICLASGRRKLPDKGVSPEIAIELAEEARLWHEEQVRRTWDQVQASIQRRRLELEALRADKEPFALPKMPVSDREMEEYF